MLSKYELSLAVEKLVKNVQSLHAKVDLLPKLFYKELMENLKTLSFKVTDPRLSTVTLNIAEDKTLQVLKSLPGQEVTARDVALITKRARAVESMYLNGLNRRGMIIKERRGRKVFFILKGDSHEQQ